MSTISPNMNLVVPGVGTTQGPQYAQDVNDSLTLIDQHDHSSGSGVPITPSGININSALSFGGNLATSLAGLTLIPQNSTPGNSTVYESGVDLYYVDGNGNNVRITQSGGVAGSPGSIAGLASPASASYNSGSSTFVWESGAGIAANMDAGSLLLRNLSPNSTYALTLSPPAALAANYSLTLPSLPASQKIMTLDASGNMSAPYVVDNSTIEISANTIQVKDSGIITAKIADGAVTYPKLSALNIQTATITSFGTTSSSTTNVTGLTVTITTSGRPVYIGLTNADTAPGAGNLSTITVQNIAAGSVAVAQIEIQRGSSSDVAYRTRIASTPSSGSISQVIVAPTSSIWTIDTPAAGTITYQVACAANPGVGGGQINFGRTQLIAYEL